MRGINTEIYIVNYLYISGHCNICRQVMQVFIIVIVGWRGI